MAFRILALVSLAFAGTKTGQINFAELSKELSKEIKKKVKAVVTKCDKNEDGQVKLSKSHTMCVFKELGVEDVLSNFVGESGLWNFAVKELNLAKTIMDECKANGDGKVDNIFNLKCTLKKMGIAEEDSDILSKMFVKLFNHGEAVANECKQKEDSQAARVKCVLKKMRMLNGDTKNLMDAKNLAVFNRVMKSFASKFFGESSEENEEFLENSSMMSEEVPQEEVMKKSSENGSSLTPEEEYEEEEVPLESLVREPAEEFSSENGSSVTAEEEQEEYEGVTPEEEQEEYKQGSTVEDVAEAFAKLNIEEKKPDVQAKKFLMP